MTSTIVAPSLWIRTQSLRHAKTPHKPYNWVGWNLSSISSQFGSKANAYKPCVLRRYLGQCQVWQFDVTKLPWTLASCSLLLFSCSVVSDFLRPHALKHTMLSCPSLSPGISINSCPLSQWCHSTISSSVAPFSSCPQSFPASGSCQWVSCSHQLTKILVLQL